MSESISPCVSTKAASARTRFHNNLGDWPTLPAAGHPRLRSNPLRASALMAPMVIRFRRESWSASRSTTTAM